MITVAIIDDNRMVRDGMTAMLNDLGDVGVVYASGNTFDEALLERLCQQTPRVLLLNVCLATPECLEILRQVRSVVPGCDVVVIDLPPSFDGIAQLVNAGVAGFILKDATLAEFTDTIRAVARGASVLPPCMTGSLFSQLVSVTETHRAPTTADAVHLTPREIDVISLIAQGRSNKEIAGELTIAAHTVKTHVRNVMEKLELNTRLQIAAYAHERLTARR